MNWQALSIPPDCLYRDADSIADIQCDYYVGLIEDNTFIGLMNIYFDLAWEDTYGYSLW